MFAYLGPVGVGERSRTIRLLALGTTLWTYAAMFTGSAVVGAKADVACDAWPYCADSSLLPLTFEQWVNFGHRVAVGFSALVMKHFGQLEAGVDAFHRNHLDGLHHIGEVDGGFDFRCAGGQQDRQRERGGEGFDVHLELPKAGERALAPAKMNGS